MLAFPEPLQQGQGRAFPELYPSPDPASSLHQQLLLLG